MVVKISVAIPLETKTTETENQLMVNHYWLCISALERTSGCDNTSIIVVRNRVYVGTESVESFISYLQVLIIFFQPCPI